MISGNGQIAVFTAVDISCGGIFDIGTGADQSSGISIFGIGGAVENQLDAVLQSLFTGDGGFTLDGKAVGEVVTIDNSQIVVGTCVHISGFAIFNTSAVDSGSIVFSIGRTVEFHGHAVSKGLIAADGGFALDGEVIGKSVSAVNGQISVHTGVNVSGGGVGNSSAVDFSAGIAFGIGHAAEVDTSVNGQDTGKFHFGGIHIDTGGNGRRCSSDVQSGGIAVNCSVVTAEKSDPGAGVGHRTGITVGGVSSESTGSGSFSGEGHSGRTAHDVVDVSCTGDGEVIGKSVSAGDSQIAVSTAINHLTGSAVVGHKGSGSSCDLSIGSGVGTFQSQSNILFERESTGDFSLIFDCDRTAEDSTVGSCQSGVTAAEDIIGSGVADTSLIGGTVITETAGVVIIVNNCISKGNFGRTAHDVVDVSCTGDGEVIGKSVSAVNGQIAVGTGEDTLISSAVVGHKGSGISFDSGIGSAVGFLAGSAQSQLGAVAQSLGAVEDSSSYRRDLTTGNGVGTVDSQRSISSAEEISIGAVGHGRSGNTCKGCGSILSAVGGAAEEHVNIGSESLGTGKAS